MFCEQEKAPAVWKTQRNLMNMKSRDHISALFVWIHAEIGYLWSIMKTVTRSE
jgi:hypothetical protein